jgi:hypothetical protein
MESVSFSISEWLSCSKCGLTCDAPFRPLGSDAETPELVLGSQLPESFAVPKHVWQIEVFATCPRCNQKLGALARFHGHTLSTFTEMHAP